MPSKEIGLITFLFDSKKGGYYIASLKNRMN